MSNLTGWGRAERLQVDPVQTSQDITGLIADDLARVEEEFRRELASPLQIIEEVGDFVASGGGKRVRPTLHLLCAKMCGYRGRHDVRLATVLEFIHSATLIHDDIIDGAKTRRGRPSANVLWGNSTTVLFGDYLFAKAMALALEAESLPVMEKLAEVTLRMTEGEMLQTRYVGRLDLTEAEYVKLVERKTAALFAGCCELAGLLAGVDARRQEALRRYGLNLGLAFQLIDDLLDFTSDAETLGKPAGSDLREGKVTLALIDLLSTGSDEGHRLATTILERARQGSSTDRAIERLTELLQTTGAISRTHKRARDYAAAASGELAHFDDNDARRALWTLPDLLLSRER